MPCTEDSQLHGFSVLKCQSYHLKKVTTKRAWEDDGLEDGKGEQHQLGFVIWSATQSLDGRAGSGGVSIFGTKFEFSFQP